MFTCITQIHLNGRKTKLNLTALSTDTTGQLNVLGHDGNTFGVNGTQVGILKETHKVGLSCLLKSKNSRSLKTQITLVVLGNLTDKTLEREFSDQKISRLLVTTDFAKGNGT